MPDEEMTAGEAIATWLEEAPHQTIYNEASSFRKVLLGHFGETKPDWAQLTPEAMGGVINEWLAEKRLGVELPALEGDELAGAAKLVREWLAQHEARVKKPALVSVDEFQGVLHAFHCALRGLDPFAEAKEAAGKAGQFRTDFKLRG